MLKTTFKKVLFIILTCLIVPFCLTSCGAENEIHDEKEPAPLYKLTKLADHLYRTTISKDYEWNTNALNVAGFSCSGIQNGQYRGRNYDWTYADTDLCIVQTTVTENRKHASVGVSDMSFMLNEDGSLNLDKLPFVTVDGINDAGVCIQVNVITYGENGVIPHTETTEDDLEGAKVVRYILDNATSVNNAISLLEEKDVHSEMYDLEELHWMISGPTTETDKTIKTVVVEVFPDGLHITEDFVDDKPIMTNMNVANFDGTAATVGLGMGYERWQILAENFDQANSVMGTFDLMEKVYYSKMYDLYSDNFWYSEYNLTVLNNYYTEEELIDLLGKETYDFYMENYGAVYYTADLWDGEAALHGDTTKAGIIGRIVEKATKNYNEQSMEDGKLWITVHTSVYDLENLTLDIQVRESQDHLHFSIIK